MRQKFIFLLVGIISALVDILIMQVLIFQGSYFSNAVLIGFIGGLLVNYTLHLRLTFSSAHSFGTVLRFSMVVAINLGITLGLTFLSQNIFSDILIGKLASLPIVAAFGYYQSKLWVFK